jgi:hypothetical protein
MAPPTAPKILSAMYAALNSDPSDPDVIIKLNISNAFNTLCHQLTLDVLGGKASCDYAFGLKVYLKRVTILRLFVENCATYLSISGRCAPVTKSHLRYFYCGNVLDVWGKTGGQEGDPLGMIVF